MPATRDPFGLRLRRVLDSRGPLCVGIDPHPQILQSWGLDRTAAGLERCARTMVETVAGEVAMIKPQSAFFEAYGSAGIAVLERVVTDAQALGTLVLLDVKRGDIGSTMAAYAQAYLADGSPLATDAITVSPYLGVEALEPAFATAEQTGRGVFVLALTSNVEAATVQRARGNTEVTVAQAIVDGVGVRNHGVGDEAPGSFGVVIGATHERLDLDLSGLHGPILAPGLGAQGGTAATLAGAFAGATDWLIPTSSRGIMSAGPDPQSVLRRVRETAADVRALSPHRIWAHRI